MRFRDFHKNIKIRIIEGFISSFISSMVYPFMAIYLAHHFGVKLAGILLLINVFVGVAINFFGGYFSDRIGRKKMMAIAEFMHLIIFLTMALCNSPFYQSAIITYLMMTLNSISWGIGGPAVQAMLIDVSKPEQRKTMYSIMYWANNLSIALGGLIGGFMFKNYLFELFIVLSFVSLVSVTLVLFFIDESYKPNQQIERVTKLKHITNMFSSYRSVFKDRVFILFVLASTLVLSMEFQLTNYVGIHLANDFGLQKIFSWEVDGIQALAFLRTENTIFVVILALFATKLVEKMNDRFVLLFTSFIFVMGYGIISYSTNLWILFIVMFIATAGEVLSVPVQQKYTSHLPPDDARSSYMAISGLSFNLMTLICSITISLSAFLSSLGTTIMITIIGLLGVVIYFVIGNQLEKRVFKSSQKESSLLKSSS
ncbi:MDR family MFS transporter [Bacillus thuringiensis]|uniref:MFS transporter n=1 Tax=Bacillus thuringiensis TaxID=1428 RepID=A0A9X7BLA0_BACTU|nr:MFS transporter [Bacillus thuringiensis]MED4445714.1 MFS transporter [Bacillus cereus]PEB44122.1 MFS transporter [Bacillus thuringiensis]PED25002.1 MFS transporter [Bacillus thuringiensis]PFL11135.1 MFS transporter [Bacillus thuringiensis]PFV27991.1 MFS transporter [Bacillus thuringiensis]